MFIFLLNTSLYPSSFYLLVQDLNFRNRRRKASFVLTLYINPRKSKPTKNSNARHPWKVYSRMWSPVPLLLSIRAFHLLICRCSCRLV